MTDFLDIASKHSCITTALYLGANTILIILCWTLVAAIQDRTTTSWS